MVKIYGFTKHLKVSAVTSTMVCAGNETWFEIINILLLILNEWSKIVVSRLQRTNLVLFRNDFSPQESQEAADLSRFFSFQVLSFPGPLFLPPGCWNIFSLKLAVKGILLNLLTNVFLTTNTGAIFAIPLQIFSAPTQVL